MKIEKNEKVFSVKENLKSWTVSRTIDILTISYNVSKADCPTLESLQKYVNDNEVF